MPRNSKKDNRDKNADGKVSRDESDAAPVEAAREAARAWQKQAADAFKALSDPTRLRIFDVLRHASASMREEGMSVGEVCDRLLSNEAQSIKDPSTISHHLKELRQAGLITMERSGQHRLCRVSDPMLVALGAYLCADTASPRKDDSKIETGL